MTVSPTAEPAILAPPRGRPTTRKCNNESCECRCSCNRLRYEIWICTRHPIDFKLLFVLGAAQTPAMRAPNLSTPALNTPLLIQLSSPWVKRGVLHGPGE